jgi:hypothetical protein
LGERREALARAGGLEPIRGAIIDDCALARRIKLDEHGGRHPIWLGLTDALRSIRPYQGLGGIWSMIARSAYAQLGYSPVMLTLAVAGMTILYLAPPLFLLTYPLHGEPVTAALGGLAWLLMAVAMLPTLRLYRQPIGCSLLLPVAAFLYCAMTVDSALAHWRGRGGAWKGRTHSTASPSASGR